MRAKTRKKTQPRLPSLRQCHGRGFVELDRQRICLGPWNARETRQAYERTIAE